MYWFTSILQQIRQAIFSVPVLPWVILPEETLTNYLGVLQVTYGPAVTYLVLFNAALILVDFAVIHFVWRYSKKARNLKTPRFFRWLTRGKPVSDFDLFIFALTPHCQKFGVLAWHAQRERLGWRGYASLVLGGSARLLVYPLLKEKIVLLILLFVILRILEWWQNGSDRGQQSCA